MKFANFKLARKLKEKGYPQEKKNTLAMYNEVGDWYSLAKNLDDFEYSFEDFDEYDYICPTISQALKWLREEKNIHIEIRLFICGYGFDILEIYPKNKIAWSGSLEYETFEQASVAGIEYVLDNLI